MGKFRSWRLRLCGPLGMLIEIKEVA
jgi:hypothetical protein